MPSPHAADARFRALFDAEARAVLGYALRRVETPEDAADVVAETFAVVWRRIGAVPGGELARPWIFGVARKVLANQRRGELRRRSLTDRLKAELAGVRIEPPDGALGAALASLDAADREVLLLTGWEGLSPAEIAQVLGMPPATIRTRLHRARARLKAALDPVPATAASPEESR